MFKLYKEQLNNKWWHRLMKVIFIFSIIFIIFCAIVACVIKLYNIYPTGEKDIVITNNLYQYTAKSDEKIVNTIPKFLSLPDRLGCVNIETNRISYISEDSLLKGYCNSNLKMNLDSALAKLKEENPQIQNYLDNSALEKILAEDKVTRMCFISKNDVDCTHSKIIKYKIKPIVYVIECLKIIGINILILFIWIIICIGIYKSILYIIFGSQK